MKITFTEKIPTIPKFNANWAGGQTNDQFRLWHLNQFSEAAQTGIELIFPHDSVTITNPCPSPFKHLSNDFYQLELDSMIGTPINTSVLVVPHYKFYTDATTPLPVMTSWQTDWWGKPISIIFKYNNSCFKQGEPFAQLIPIERNEMQFQEMSEIEINRRKKMLEPTRTWTTKDGVVLDNLYNVMYQANKNHKKKRFRLI